MALADDSKGQVPSGKDGNLEQAKSKQPSRAYPGIRFITVHEIKVRNELLLLLDLEGTSLSLRIADAERAIADEIERLECVRLDLASSVSERFVAVSKLNAVERIKWSAVPTTDKGLDGMLDAWGLNGSR